MVAVSDFSGFCSSICALASAPAIAPMVSLDRCMSRLRLMKIKADRARFGAPGPHAVADGLFGVLRHQLFEFGLGGIVLVIGGAGLEKDPGKFRPAMGGAYVDDSEGLALGARRLDAEQARG